MMSTADVLQQLTSQQAIMLPATMQGMVRAGAGMLRS
jgi:hypothetical protein